MAADARVIGQKIGAGAVRALTDVASLHEFVPGEVLVADMTDPNWEPIMKRASAIVTNRGWRTCHAAILACEFGIPAVVGTGTATVALADGREVTISCAEDDTGCVYDGLRECTVTERVCRRCPGDRAEHNARWNPGARPGRRLGPPSRSSCGRRTLGLARDSALVAGSFGGRDPAVKVMLTGAIKARLTQDTYVGICGQGPSDHPDLADWLVDECIESTPLNPDTVVDTWLRLSARAR